MEFLKRHRKKILGAVLAGVGAALMYLEQKEAAAAVGMLSTLFIGGGSMKSDAGK